MKYYGFLIPSSDASDETKRGSGYWCITKKGIDFVEGRIKVPRYFYMYNRKCLGFDGDEIGIVDALQKKFDYRELMGDYYTQEPTQGGLL